MFERLNTEQETALKELVELEASGGFPVRKEPSDDLNYAQRIAFVGIYKELRDLGFIPEKSLSIDMQPSATVLVLTSKARTYFEEKKQAEKDRKKSNWRVWALRIVPAIFTLVLGYVLGYFFG